MTQVLIPETDASYLQRYVESPEINAAVGNSPEESITDEDAVSVHLAALDIPTDFDPYTLSASGRGILYMLPMSAPNEIETLSGTIRNPFGAGGIALFLDEMPYSNWSHRCQYIFLKNYSVQSVAANLPPITAPLIKVDERL